MSKVGRNEPCPCGSGKKYKKCCLPRAEALESETPAYMQESADYEEYSGVDDGIDPFVDELDDAELEARIREEHRLTKESNIPLHLAIHKIVESQLAANDPPEVRKALNRLLESGKDQHEAIHTIGGLVTDMMFHALKERQNADVEAYRKALQQL